MQMCSSNSQTGSPLEEPMMNDIDLSTDGRKAGMKAISLISPWWWFVLHAGKNLENRTWRHAPSYRGPLLIHASKTYVFRDVLDDMYTAADKIGRASCRERVCQYV